jgi:Tfp pilus assembly protein PilO
MSAKARNLSPQVLDVLVGVAGLLVLLAGVFVLVLPQRHKAATLSDQLVKTKTQIVTARALAAQRPEERIRVADLFKVVQAMPDDTDMTGIMLQLQQTAGEVGVKFDSIQPQPVTAGSGYDVQPIDLSFVGNY